MEEWTNKKLMKFSTDKCKVLHLEQNNSMKPRRQATEQAEKDLGMLVDSGLCLSKYCTLAAGETKGILGCTSTCEAASGFCIHFWAYLLQ